MRKLFLAVLIFLAAFLFSGTARATSTRTDATLSAAASTCTATGTVCLIVPVDNNQGGATFTISTNAGGNTIQFEASGDGGGTWVAISVTPSNSTTTVTSTASTGTWQANVAGYTHVRMRMSTLSSGTNLVSITQSTASARAIGGGLSFVAALPATCTPGVTASVQLSVTPFTVNYCDSTNHWTALTAGTGANSGTTGQSAFFSGTNLVSGGTVVLDMAGVSGADLGAKMNNCATALPAGGGTCKGDNLSGALTLSTAVTTAKAVIYTFCGQSITQTGAFTATNANSGIVGCPGGSATFTKGANIDQITLNGNNTVVSGISLAGASGSFTGSGIVTTSLANFAQITGNYISGEASQAIKASGLFEIIMLNEVSQSAAAAAISVPGNNDTVSYNIVTANTGDGIDVSGNQEDVTGNFINLTLTSAVSGVCGINANGDEIGDRVAFNQTQITDSHNADVNYGVCDTPSGTHNLNMLFEGNNHFGVLPGGATADGFFLNNTNNLSTNWFVTVRDEGCVHITFCIKRTDAQNNITLYQDIQPGDVALDAGTGSTGDVWSFENVPVTFANLPTPAGNGSRGYCTNCTPGKVIQAGGSTGNNVTRSTGVWVGQQVVNWAPVQSKQANASAASVPVVFTNANTLANFIAVGIECNQAASPTLAVSDTQGNTYTSAHAIQATPGGNQWIQIFYAQGIKAGANTVSASSSVNACTYVSAVVAEYSGISLNSPEDGAGAGTNGTSAAAASGSFAVTPNDLVFGEFMCAAGGAGIGAGFTSRGTDANSMAEDTTPAGATSNALGVCNSGGWAAMVVAFTRQP